MKQVLKKVLIVIAPLFILYSVIWFVAVNVKYHHYITGMEEIYTYRTYALVSEDGYTYNVKFPSYLHGPY